jgi:hypothetical protein
LGFGGSGFEFRASSVGVGVEVHDPGFRVALGVRFSHDRAGRHRY